MACPCCSELQETGLEIATIIVSAYGDMTNIRTAMIAVRSTS